MAANDSKLDLPQEDCTFFEVSGGVGTPIDGLGPLLAEDGAISQYRRSKTAHYMMLFLESDQDSFRGLWVAPEADDPLPSNRGEPWRALDLLYEAADTVDIQCHFDVPASTMKPLIKLPLILVEDGPFAFNQIQGYRAARVEGDETVWTAILDRYKNTGGYHLLVRFDDYKVREASPRDLFRKCVAVKEALFWRGVNDA